MQILPRLTFTLIALNLMIAPAFAKPIGVLAAVQGDVKIHRDGKTIGVKSGDALHEKDRVKVKSGNGIQLMLMDETVFTLYKNADFTVDHFEYNAQNKSGRIQVTNRSGALKFSTGYITNGDPENFKIMLPEGNMVGVKGTVGLISVLTPDQASQQFPDQTPQTGGAPNQPVVFAALTGPGPQSQNGANTGSFNFSTPNGSVDLNRPGGAVLATPGAPPVFFIAPPGSIRNISQSSSSGSSNNGETHPDENNNTDNSSNASIAMNGTDGSNLFLADNAGLVDPAGFNSETREFSGTLQELVAVNSGSVEGGGTYTGTITGDFDFLIDFANRTFDMQSYNLNGGGLTNDSIDVQGSSAALPADNRTSLTVGNNGEDFAATVSGGCGNCSVNATFPTNSSISATITNGGNNGTTGAINF